MKTAGPTLITRKKPKDGQMSLIYSFHFPPTRVRSVSRTDTDLFNHTVKQLIREQNCKTPNKGR